MTEQVQPTSGFTRWTPFIEVPHRVTVAIHRQERRGKCANCQHRRELYRVVLHASNQSEARCADCWWGR